MSAATLAYANPEAGPASVVQIDVGSFIALMSMVAKHVDLAPFEGQLAKTIAPAQGNVTEFDVGRSHTHGRETAARSPGDGPEASLVNMLVGAFTPTLGNDTAEVVPLAPSRSGRVHPFGKTWLHVDSAKLVDADGREIALTAMEFRLLRLFAENRGRVLNRDQILEGAHDRSWDPFDRSIDIRISRIRKKIEHNPRKPEVIRTVRGIGYIYDPA